MAQLKNAMRLGGNDSGKIGLSQTSTNNISALNGGGAIDVITAAQNTGGVIVRTLVVTGRMGTNARGLVYADSTPLFSAHLLDNRETWNADREIILPAGVALSVAVTNSNCSARATWDDLP